MDSEGHGLQGSLQLLKDSEDAMIKEAQKEYQETSVKNNIK